MSIFIRSNSSLFQKILINTNKSNSVSARYIWDCFDFTSHHDNSSLNVFNLEIIWFSRNIVWSLNSNFHSWWNSSWENSSESIESTFIICRNHLWDENTEWTIFVTFFDGLSSWIIFYTFMKIYNSVSLNLEWTWQFHNNHFK